MPWLMRPMPRKADPGAEPRADLARADLARADLARADLARADLAGAGVLITRPQAQQASAQALVRDHGGVPHAMPLIEVQDRDPDPESLQAWQALKPDDWLVAVSPTAVEALDRWLARAGLERPELHLAAVGPGTARAIQARGWTVAACPTQGDGAQALLNTLFDELGPQALSGRRVALARGEGGRRVLDEAIPAAGGTVVDLRLYRRLAPALDGAKLSTWLNAGALDYLAVTSATALDHLRDHLMPQLAPELKSALQALAVVAPGARVLQKAQSLGFDGPLLDAGDASDHSMVQAIARHRAQKR